MNLYLLVEGRRTEKKIYRSWMNFVFPHLSEVSTVEDVQENNYFLISGLGYPSYLQRIPAALRDIANHGSFDHFFVYVDAEDLSIDQKAAELQFILDGGPIFSNSHTVIHNCCIETWFLGHSRICRQNPHSQKLRDFKTFYDVSINDPELMQSSIDYDTKAQFHYDYLRAIFEEQGLHYTKEFPGCTSQKHYFDALVDRHRNTHHIDSFGRLIEIWTNVGGII